MSLFDSLRANKKSPIKINSWEILLSINKGFISYQIEERFSIGK